MTAILLFYMHWSPWFWTLDISTSIPRTLIMIWVISLFLIRSAIPPSPLLFSGIATPKWRKISSLFSLKSWGTIMISHQEQPRHHDNGQSRQIGVPPSPIPTSPQSDSHPQSLRNHPQTPMGPIIIVDWSNYHLSSHWGVQTSYPVRLLNHIINSLCISILNIPPTLSITPIPMSFISQFQLNVGP